MQSPINIQCQFDSIPDKWKTILEPHSHHFQNIQNKIDTDFILYKDSCDIYPEPSNIFRAFKEVQLEDIRVVIIGQDCYHKPGQAIGRAFGVPPNKTIPPSLRNISKELFNDTGIILDDFSLEKWSKQGVMLLNSALTVRQSSPGSHLNVWKDFTDKVINTISKNTNGVVFFLWGKYAQSKQQFISSYNNHLILCANHPSPLSANKGGWFGSSHFSKANDFLIDKIDW